MTQAIVLAPPDAVIAGRGKGVMGIATCADIGPLMMIDGARVVWKKPAVLVSGGVTLLPESGEDAGKVQSIGARFAQNQITLDYAADIGCRACASPGGGCQFLGTAATSQVVGEALGLSLPHTALAPSGQPVWLDAARRSARAILRLHQLTGARATSSLPRRSATRWCCTRRSAARRICSSMFRP